MEILSLKAFVLRRIRYGESSLITSLFSEERGKLSVIAKGARSAKSKSGMASILEPLNLIEAEVYFKPSREIQIISKADIIADFSLIKSNLDRMEAIAKVFRTLDALTHADEPNQKIWLLLEKTLREISSAPMENLSAVVLAFKARILSALGYEPILSRCSICDCGIEGRTYFAVESGGLICADCGPRGIPLEMGDVETLRILFETEDLFPGKLADEAKIAKIIRRHGEYHTDKKLDL